MPFVSTLKESFALASASERQDVVNKLAVPNTNDSYYYQGLILLQKIHAELMKFDNPVQPRAPTPVEIELSSQLQEIIKKLKENCSPQYYQKLETRFNLLAYPFQTTASVDYLKEEHNLLSGQHQSSVQSTDKEKMSEVKKVPSSLDPSLIDGMNLVQQEVEKNLANLDPMAFPQIDAMWDKLSRKVQLKLIDMSKSDASIQLLGPDIVNKLATLWNSRQKGEDTSLPAMTYFTLAQMDSLIRLAPDMVLLDTTFVKNYLTKLVPTNARVYTVWDDHENVLKDYLELADSFAKRLPPIYRQLKLAIKFHKLRIDITRQAFDQDNLISFLSCFTGVSSVSRVRGNEKSVLLPLFGDCGISDTDCQSVIEEYLTGLIMQSKFTMTLNSLGEYLDYHRVVKPLIAKINLTTHSLIQDDWIRDLGNSAYESLVKESIVSFANTSLRASVKRKPSDTISLTVKTKNILRLSVRVFQIDTENYWKLHLNDVDEETTDINLDGFHPTFEKDFDFSSESALRVNYTEFKFGQDELAPEVFHGRGLWVIEFVGGENQCRAIIQKGYLSHIVQNTIAGHVLRVLDEEGQAIQNAKVLYNRQVYQADDNSNILIPYQDQNQRKKIILVSPTDKYCEPCSFYHLGEYYNLDASFYVNPEMVSFNKTATVVVLPKLTLNNMPAPLSLLSNDMVLTVETNTVGNIKNTSTCQKSGSSGDAFLFEFMVPDQLTNIEFTLKVKVKTTSNKSVDLTTFYTSSYSSLYEDKGIVTSFHLKKMANGSYYIYVFGKNGEVKKNYELTVSLAHLFKTKAIDVKLQTNDDGFVDLGILEDIKYAQASDNQGRHKKWTILTDNGSANLPSKFYVAENEAFKFSCNITLHDSLYSLYRLGNNDQILEDVTTAYLKKSNNSVAIGGLAEGKYKLNLPSFQNGVRSVQCVVIKPQLKSVERGLWSGWLLGEHNYAKQNKSKPLRISGLDMTNGGLQIKLDHWSSKTFAVVTTSTFVPATHESLYENVLLKQTIAHVPLQNYGVDSTRSLFLNDKRISEEYQYILNRAKAEKWTGSNLANPALLVYPKKHKDTYAAKRNLDRGVDKQRQRNPMFSGFMGGGASNLRSSKNSTSFKGYDVTNLAFLDHKSPLVVIPISSDGTIVVDKKHLGRGGNLLQMVVVSGEQTVFHQQLLNDNDTLKLNDLRQNSSSNKPLVRSKAVSKVMPKENIVLHTHEYEVIDSFEKLFDTIVKISRHGGILENKFAFLKTWPTLTLQKKLELHQGNVCYEFNLWLKKKDPQFFDLHVKPAIGTKIQKEFMDWYLIDGDLSEYRDNLYVYSRLSVAEKALLASTGPKEHLHSVLKSFSDTFDSGEQVDKSDNIFDTILSQSALSAAAMQAKSRGNYDAESSDDDMGFGLFDGDSVSRVRSSSVSAVVSGVAAGVVAGVTDRSAFDEDEDDDDDEEDDFELVAEQEIEMREKAKKMHEKVTYEFVESTSEWAETGYFGLYTVTLQKFWIDYLEYNAGHAVDGFLSPDFIYSLNNINEVLFVLSLTDLPFAAGTDWKLESLSSSKIEFSINAVSHPLLVFYRKLSEYTGSFSSSPSLMLGQEIFVVDDAAPITSDECIKVDPTRTPLEPLVEYGNHLIVINISPKKIMCQLTVQIPTGTLPTRSSSYYQSKTISIQPYSTWHEVINSFYFPLSGEFSIIPVTVSSITGDHLLAKLDSIPVQIAHPNEEQVSEAYDSSTVNKQPWAKVAAKGTNDSVISYLQSYRKLENLNMSLIKWRMSDKTFARQVLDVLTDRCHYSDSIWEYGIVHQFEDIIQEYLQSSQVLTRAGYIFESPLVSKIVKNYTDFHVYDYYPLFNARAHQMKPSPEILNQEFYNQYNAFLEYLSLQTGSPSDADLVILSTYLILQDRIGEAHDAFSKIRNVENNEQCQLQIDYLQAYLKTRVLVTKDPIFMQQLDLQSIKDITNKYKDFGLLRWRQLFANLHHFACEIEQGGFSVSNNTPESKRVQSEPILEFEVDEQEQVLVVKYANIQSIEVKYYVMDIEVMFSNNPFMDSKNKVASSNKNISWIKPSISETILLPEHMEVDRNEDEDFDMIGVGQMNSLQFHRIPFNTGNKNVFIELSSGSITRQHAHYANSLSVHAAESFGVVCVTSKKTKRVSPGVYIKVYCRKKNSKEVHFWKDGYTGLNGVFDYLSVTQGNALTNNGSLKQLMSDEIEKLSILILSEEDGAMVKEVYPPEEN